ncbi:SAM-dependent methyltransferase [Roseibacillus persicicus]|uniref:SAM-dependent methyltransferase n=1 Tax=Roseibacillus persicicus TaxID=454148 RepID=A0A918WP48_9BACT|nr:SAM-dependent methyltransferase [Roseibacillus persicicus]GHC67294.1 SAM-dependent methyltransferase [Roseibacillus persicicus]
MIRFDRFMHAALYHPERGYYTSRIKSVGSRGDFTTTPQLSRALGRAIASLFQQSGCRNLVEVGPGTGLLAQTVRQALPPLTRLRIKQHLVEISPTLRKLQKAAVPKAQHHSTIQDALAACRGHAFIYSNELVDAFPVRIFRKESEGYTELYLSGKQQTLSEQFRAVEELPDSTQFKRNYPRQQRLEVHESYHQWLQDWLPSWEKGQILTIDYTIRQRQIAGSLRGYFLQDRLTRDNLYQNAGHVDLTTDVDFADLEYWGESLGLETQFLKTQSEFLQPFASGSQEDRFLLDPNGAGSAFQVLLQKK